MELLFGLSLFVSLCSFLTFQSIAGAAVDPVKVDLNQWKTTEEELKSPFKGREFATDCPAGAFHHPITGLCIYCDCVRDSDTIFSAEHKEYYTSNCANLINKCQRQFQFYDENLSICRNCSDVCGEDNQNNLCKLKCSGDRCCVDTEVYSPHSGSCILCSQICEEERNEAYCIKNCKNYNKSVKQETSTVFTTSLNNQSYHSSSTTNTYTTDGNDSNASTVIIVVVIMVVLLTVAIIGLLYLRRNNNLRCTTQHQEQGENLDNPEAGALSEENIQMLPIIQQESEIADAPPERRENGNEAAEESPEEKKPVPESGNTGDQVTSQNDSENSLSYRDLNSHDSQRRGQFDDDDDDDNEFRPQTNQSSLATERKLFVDHSASLF